MTAETIQSTIDAKADRELNAKLTKVFSEFRQNLGVQNHQTFEALTTDRLHTTLNIYKTLDALHRSVFARKKEYHRNQATEAFMQKINKLSADVDELRTIEAMKPE